VQLYRAHSQFSDGQLVLIGQATPRHAAHFRRRTEIELPILADEDRRTYALAGAKIATVGELVGPAVLAKGAAVGRREGVHQGKTIGHAAQLGGTMVVRPDGSVAWSHMSQDASDNATPEEILAALQRA
jgi:peroxiredoxin